MNLETFNISVTPCVVCKYAFSDKHHIWPQAKGGKSLPTMLLCPNHHRFANLVQAMLLKGTQPEEIESFAQRYFDSAFNTTVLTVLITEQERLRVYGCDAYIQQREQDASANPQSALVAAAAFARTRKRYLAYLAPDEGVPMIDHLEGVAHIAAVMTVLLPVTPEVVRIPSASGAELFRERVVIDKDEHRYIVEMIEYFLLLGTALRYPATD